MSYPSLVVPWLLGLGAFSAAADAHDAAENGTSHTSVLGLERAAGARARMPQTTRLAVLPTLSVVPAVFLAASTTTCRRVIAVVVGNLAARAAWSRLVDVIPGRG